MPPPRRSADVPVVHQATVLKNGVGSRGCCGKLVQLTKVGRGGIDHNGSLYMTGIFCQCHTFGWWDSTWMVSKIQTKTCWCKMVPTSLIIVTHPTKLLEICRDVGECFKTSTPMLCQLNSYKSILYSLVGPCSTSSYFKNIVASEGIINSYTTVLLKEFPRKRSRLEAEDSF